MSPRVSFHPNFSNFIKVNIGSAAPAGTRRRHKCERQNQPQPELEKVTEAWKEPHKVASVLRSVLLVALECWLWISAKCGIPRVEFMCKTKCKFSVRHKPSLGFGRQRFRQRKQLWFIMI